MNYKSNGNNSTYSCIKKNKIAQNKFNQGGERSVHWKQKSLMKGIEKDTNKWKAILCSWIRRINTVKMSIVLKAIYRFSVISIKIPVAFFTEIEQIILKSSWNQPHKTLNSPCNHKDEEQSWRCHTPAFILYFKVIAS